MKETKKKRDRVVGGIAAATVCVLILLVAWGTVMALVLMFTKAWAEDPMPRVSDTQRKIAIEAVELEDALE